MSWRPSNVPRLIEKQIKTNMVKYPTDTHHRAVEQATMQHSTHDVKLQVGVDVNCALPTDQQTGTTILPLLHAHNTNSTPPPPSITRSITSVCLSISIPPQVNCLSPVSTPLPDVVPHAPNGHIQHSHQHLIEHICEMPPIQHRFQQQPAPNSTAKT